MTGVELTGPMTSNRHNGTSVSTLSGMMPFAAVDFDPRQMPYWAHRALEEDYVVFIVDSWSQRGIPDGVCFKVVPGFAPMPVRTRDLTLDHVVPRHRGGRPSPWGTQGRPGMCRRPPGRMVGRRGSAVRGLRGGALSAAGK